VAVLSRAKRKSTESWHDAQVQARQRNRDVEALAANGLAVS
jgi:hypothetical protein